MKKNLKLRYKKDKERKRDMGDRAETRDGLGMPCSVLHTQADKTRPSGTVKDSRKLWGGGLGKE